MGQHFPSHISLLSSSPNMEVQESSSLSSRFLKNLKEKNRRRHLKNLQSKLASLVPSTSKLSTPELLSHATIHINQMHARLEELKRRKAEAEADNNKKSLSCRDYMEVTSSRIKPALAIRSDEYTVEVNLICGLTENFMILEVMNVLQDEAAEVISFSCNRNGDRFIYTIKSQAIYGRIGIDTQKIHGRLNELIQWHA